MPNRAPTPNRARTQSSSAHRPAPSPEKQREMARKREAARLAEERRRAAETRRNALRRRRRRLLSAMSLGLALVFLAAYWLVIALVIHNRPQVTGEAFPLLVFTEGNQKEDLSFAPEEVSFGGVNYLPVTVLEQYFPITLYGDDTTRSFLLENGEEATFYLDRSRVVVNGQNASLSANALLRDGVLYLPVDFYTGILNCFTFAYSSALKGNVLTYLPEAAPSFAFHEPQSSVPVDIATVPAAPAPTDDPAQNS